MAFGKGWEDMEDEAKPGEFYIDSLSVSLPYRNQGVGTALIKKAKKIAQGQGISMVTLAVEPMNTAKKLYQELGFAYQRTYSLGCMFFKEIIPSKISFAHGAATTLP